MRDENKRPEMSEGEKKPFGGDNGKTSYKDHEYRGSRPAPRPANRTFGGRNDDKRGGKPGFGGERRYGKPAFAGQSGEKRLFRGEDRRSGGDERPARSFNRPESGEKRSFGGDRPAFRKEFSRPSGDRPFNREDRRPTSGNRPAGDRPFRKDGPRPEGERRPFGGDRPFHKDGPRLDFRKGPRPAGPRADAPRRERPGATDGMPARRIALEVIRNVTENGAYASLFLDEKLLGCGLSLADRRLVSRLVYDTLEHLIYIDHALSQVMAREDTDIKLRNILRLGACQLLIMDRIPEYTATDTSVQLCKELGMEGLGGVCNGILRNLIRKKDELTWPDPETDVLKARSVKYSMPEWLVERLTEDWGRFTADAMMASHGDTNYVTVRPNLMTTSDAALEELLNKKVWEWTPGEIPHSYHIRGLADVSRDTDFSEGKFSIQGESSMMAALAVAPKRGWRVLDACAAPGGKTCLMAEMMDGTGRVQAWEIRPHRTELVEAQAKRLHLENVRPMTRDAAKAREDMIETMDAVLLDAPCSGTGDMWEKPDVRYRLKPENVDELVKTQETLLDAVCSYVKRGGVLVYSTCSVLKAENEQQIAAFLERHPDFKLDTLPETIPEKFRQHADVGLQLMPQRDHVGGFYICRMRRKL